MTIPLDLSGITTAVQLSPNMRWTTESSWAVEAGNQFMGERICAEQYHRVGARYVYIKDGVQPSPKQLKLLHVLDLKTSRGESSAADLELDEIVDLTDEADKADEEEYGGAYWKKFEEELQDIKDEYGLRVERK